MSAAPLLLLVADFADPAEPFPPVLPESLADAAVPSCIRGFIWMIFLDLVGGGGRANEQVSLSPLLPLAEDDRRRDLTVSAACNGYVVRGEDEENVGG